MSGRNSWLAALLGLAMVLLPMPVPAKEAPRQTIPLQEGWSFHQGELQDAPLSSSFDDSGWRRVSLPHTWNRLGEYRTQRSEATNNYQGTGWYRLRFATPVNAARKRVLVQFDGVGTIADVWVNGVHVGRHRGGYSGFRFDVTPFLSGSGDNVLVVKADNSKPRPGSSTANVLPLSGDFFPYGGLYRGVSLVVAPAMQIDLLDHGGPGVYASVSSLDDTVAQVDVVTRLRNLGTRSYPIRAFATISDDRGVAATSASAVQRVAKSGTASIRQSLTVPNPWLWQGRADPHLYKVTVELRAGRRVIDRVEQPLGIRTMRLDPERGFFLNGKPLALHGVSRHQDMADKGAALSDEDHVRDMDLIEELGANTIRIAHYQQAQKWLELANERGMVVWAEIPYVSMATFGDGEPPAQVVENARQQLTELIRQNFNHPSVAVWGVGNEIDSLTLGGKAVKARGLLQALHDLAKAEDPRRPTAFADCCAGSPFASHPDVEVLVGTTDAVGYNRYPGWYSPDPKALGPILDSLRQRFPRVPMSVTEYGAGGALTQHSDNPRGGAINAFGRPHPEEYQGWVHEENWRVLRDRPYLWATWVWNMFDFASDFRAEGDAIDLNDKGLVTFDRKTRKDAFYFYKANWSSAPVVHINGRRHAQRAYPAADISVYSNARDVALKVNGADAGLQPCPDRICTWRNVALSPGANRLVASATIDGVAISDEMTLQGPDPDRDGIRINAGYLTSLTLGDGRRFGSDHFFAGGEAKALNPKDITALFERRGAKDKAVTGAANPVLHEGYREGRFSYSIPMPNGRWQVRLSLFEPQESAPAKRTFSVVANGKRMLDRFDPFDAAGGSLKEVTRSFPVAVQNGRLELAFEPESGPAIVSAIEIVR